jgi:hypothetical protein
MTISKVWLWLSVLAGLLAALSSAAGIFFAGTYARETVNWATQGSGQDVVNLFLAVPALFISAYLVKQESFRALLVWLGTLMYLLYSYVLYSFFIHFGPWFPVYVAILGCSFYSLAGSFMDSDWKGVSPLFVRVNVKPGSAFLMFIAVIFYVLWAGEVIKALLGHTMPKGLNEIGLPVNPIHVLDMAFFLPATAIVSVKLWRRKTLGLLLAVPLLVFLVLMGIAIISMMLLLAARGFPSSVSVEAALAVLVLVSLYMAAKFLTQMNG